MSSTRNRHPRCEQLVTADDLDRARLAAERPDCMHCSDVLDRFILSEFSSVALQLAGAGVPATLALTLSARMAEAARASALAVASAYWRELLPATPPTPSPGR